MQCQQPAACTAVALCAAGRVSWDGFVPLEYFLIIFKVVPAWNDISIEKNSGDNFLLLSLRKYSCADLFGWAVRRGVENPAMGNVSIGLRWSRVRTGSCLLSKMGFVVIYFFFFYFFSFLLIILMQQKVKCSSSLTRFNKCREGCKDLLCWGKQPNDRLTRLRPPHPSFLNKKQTKTSNLIHILYRPTWSRTP